MSELVTSIRTVERGAHAEVSIWVHHALTGTLTMQPEEAERFRALLEGAKQAEMALREIREQQGKVCEGYDLCTHTACASSYASWAIADAALAAAPGEEGLPPIAGRRQIAPGVTERTTPPHPSDPGQQREISTRRMQDGVVHEMADLGIKTQCGLDLREPWTWTDDPVTCEQCRKAEDNADRAAWLEAELGDAPGRRRPGGRP